MRHLPVKVGQDDTCQLNVAILDNDANRRLRINSILTQRWVAIDRARKPDAKSIIEH